MNTDEEILETLKRMREAQAEMLARQEQALAKQDEALQFLKQQAERTNKVSVESVALQRQAVERAKRIGYVAIPGILICIFLIVYLVVRYRIF